MRNLKNDLEELVRDYLIGRDESKNYKKDQEFLEKMKTMKEKAPLSISDDFDLLIVKLEESLKLKEDLYLMNHKKSIKEKEEVVSIDFKEKQLKDLLEYQKEKRFELVLSGTVEELEKFNRFAEKHKINLICSVPLERISVEEVEEEYKSFALSLEDCDLLLDYFNNDKKKKIYKGLFYHFDEIEIKSGSYYNIDREKEEHIGLIGNKILIKIPTENINISQHIQNILETDLKLAIIFSGMIIENKKEIIMDLENGTNTNTKNIENFLKIIPVKSEDDLVLEKKSELKINNLK